MNVIYKFLKRLFAKKQDTPKAPNKYRIQIIETKYKWRETTERSFCPQIYNEKRGKWVDLEFSYYERDHKCSTSTKCGKMAFKFGTKEIAEECIKHYENPVIHYNGYEIEVGIAKHYGNYEPTYAVKYFGHKGKFACDRRLGAIQSYIDYESKPDCTKNITYTDVK